VSDGSRTEVSLSKFSPIVLPARRPKFAVTNIWLLIALGLLYGMTMAHLGLNWVFTRNAYILNSDTSAEIFDYLLFGEPLSTIIALGVLSTGTALIADGILVSLVHVNDYKSPSHAFFVRYGEHGLFGEEDGSLSSSRVSPCLLR
jgi:hypothetical protein